MKKLFLSSVICILVSGVIIAQESNKISLIGSKAPSFSAQSTNDKLTFPNVVETNNQWKVHLEEIDYKGRGNQKFEFPINDDQKIVASKKYGISLDFNSIKNS
jgi:peroxiredoxin (alkyl hydroperoxide reductase subunit C)